MLWPARIWTLAAAPGTLPPSQVAGADHGPLPAERIKSAAAAEPIPQKSTLKIPTIPFIAIRPLLFRRHARPQTGHSLPTNRARQACFPAAASRLVDPGGLLAGGQKTAPGCRLFR